MSLHLVCHGVEGFAGTLTIADDLHSLSQKLPQTNLSQKEVKPRVFLLELGKRNEFMKVAQTNRVHLARRFKSAYETQYWSTQIKTYGNRD